MAYPREIHHNATVAHDHVGLFAAIVPLQCKVQNARSAKSRFSMCAENIREELRSSSVDNKDLRSQFGAVLGMLGH